MSVTWPLVKNVRQRFIGFAVAASDTGKSSELESSSVIGCPWWSAEFHSVRWHPFRVQCCSLQLCVHCLHRAVWQHTWHWGSVTWSYLPCRLPVSMASMPQIVVELYMALHIPQVGPNLSPSDKAYNLLWSFIWAYKPMSCAAQTWPLPYCQLCFEVDTVMTGVFAWAAVSWTAGVELTYVMYIVSESSGKHSNCPSFTTYSSALHSSVTPGWCTSSCSNHNMSSSNWLQVPKLMMPAQNSVTSMKITDYSWQHLLWTRCGANSY